MQSLSVWHVPLCKKGIMEVACVYSSTLGVLLMLTLTAFQGLNNKVHVGTSFHKE